MVKRPGIKIFNLLLLIIIIGGTAVYFTFADKAYYRDMLIKIDMLGISAAAKNEKARLDKIDALNIPFAQREALKRRTIFINANKEMVKLAFGPSPNPVRFTQDGKEVWVYFFSDYDRPILLIFEANILVAAQRGSSADVAEFK